MNTNKSRSEIVMESYLKGRLPELHRLGVTKRSIYAPRPQTGKGASWMSRKEAK